MIRARQCLLMWLFSLSCLTTQLHGSAKLLQSYEHSDKILGYDFLDKLEEVTLEKITDATKLQKCEKEVGTIINKARPTIRCELYQEWEAYKNKLKTLSIKITRPEQYLLTYSIFRYLEAKDADERNHYAKNFYEGFRDCIYKTNNSYEKIKNAVKLILLHPEMYKQLLVDRRNASDAVQINGYIKKYPTAEQRERAWKLFQEKFFDDWDQQVASYQKQPLELLPELQFIMSKLTDFAKKPNDQEALVNLTSEMILYLRDHRTTCTYEKLKQNILALLATPYAYALHADLEKNLRLESHRHDMLLHYAIQYDASQREAIVQVITKQLFTAWDHDERWKFIAKDVLLTEQQEKNSLLADKLFTWVKTQKHHDLVMAAFNASATEEFPLDLFATFAHGLLKCPLAYIYLVIPPHKERDRRSERYANIAPAIAYAFSTDAKQRATTAKSFDDNVIKELLKP